MKHAKLSFARTSVTQRSFVLSILALATACAWSGAAGVPGADIDYKALNGHRMRAGELLTLDVASTWKPYVGVAVEHIITGKAEGRADDSLGAVALKAAEGEGTTGIVTAGWSFTNEAKSFEFGLSVDGFAGARNGVSGTVEGCWQFLVRPQRPSQRGPQREAAYGSFRKRRGYVAFKLLCFV